MTTHLEPVEQAQQTVATLAKNVESINNTWRYQFLNNADQLREAFDRLLASKDNGISNGKLKKEFAVILKNLIHDPFFRQMGRLTCVHRTLQELNNTLEK